ncbi:auxin response factor 17-like [Zingiber officinale]|uniref:auxin response factor 17-like n=1 Tax=Zingiber officinale TaxID=94328 RepID=UPI001C4B41B9|nr:auxin response factor 17-like [Zingiber officinale]
MELFVQLDYRATNNETEYEAIIVDLQATQHVGATKILIHSDSQLVAQQLSGAITLSIIFAIRASPSEFVIPLDKYVKAVYHTRVSIGMHFRMLFETEESSVCRYMGTVTGISDLDPVRWPNSYWRSVKVGWDESTSGERQPRVSLWEIEPLTTFPMYPSSFPLRLKRPWPSDLPSLHGGRDDLMWLRDGDRAIQSLNFQRFCNQTFTECYFKSWKCEWLKGKRTLRKI